MSTDRLEQDVRAWMDATAPAQPHPRLVDGAMDRITQVTQLPPWRARLVATLPRAGAPAGLLPTPARLVLLLLALVAVAAAAAAAFRLMTPAPRVWTPVDPPLTARHQMSLVTLADGRVLMAGGVTPDAADEPVLGAEIWDPGTGAWSAAGDLTLDRRDSLAVLLTDGRGRVLVLDAETYAEGPAAGGTAEVFDPATGGFSPAGRLLARHGGGIGGSGWAAPLDAVMIPLPEGRALVLGGRPEQTADGTGFAPAVAEVWDPGDGSFHATEPLPCDPSRGTAAPLPDGTVLIVCNVPDTGVGRMGARQPLWEPDAVVLDPVAGTFVRVTPPTTVSTGAATVLEDGRVLLTGPAISGSTDPAEIRERDGTFRRLASPMNPVASSVVVTMSDGRVLFVDPRWTTALVFDPEAEAFSTLELPAPLADGAVAPLPDGRALVVFGPDWESPGPRQYPPGPMVLDLGR